MRPEFRKQRDEIARRLLHSEGIRWPEAVKLAEEALPKCGARTKAGTPCKRKALANGRCIKHGGGTPKKTQEEREFHRRLAAMQPRDARGWFIKREAVE
jgi:hypothetical protein